MTDAVLDKARSAPKRRVAWFFWVWTTPAGALQTLFFLVPLAFMLGITFWQVSNFQLSPDFTLRSWVKMYTAPYFLQAYLYTLSMSLLAAVIASVIAFPCAYTLAFIASKRNQRLAMFFLVTPFFTSYLVRVYSWQIVLSADGLINSALGAVGLGPLELLNNGFSTMIGFLTLCLPLVILIQVLSLSNIDGRLIQAAHNLGAGRLRTVFEVILPAGRVGLIIAACFAFMMSFGEYVSPSLLGGSKPPTLSILVVDLVKSGSDWPRAAVVAVTMIVSMTAILFVAISFAYKKNRNSDDA